MIYPNTNSGYGSTEGTSYCTEETPLVPISLYGKTKCEAEMHLLESKNALTLRLATVFGMAPRMRLDLLVNHFVYAALNEGYIVIFEKDFKRNYVHVRDVADCMLHCIANSPRMTGKPYNVGPRLCQPLEGGAGPQGEGIYLEFLHSLRRHRPGPGQAELHRVERAPAEGGLRGQAVAR